MQALITQLFGMMHESLLVLTSKCTWVQMITSGSSSMGDAVVVVVASGLINCLMNDHKPSPVPQPESIITTRSGPEIT
jgi:hypothetical protein